MGEAEEIGTKRPRKPPTRFDEECYVANDLTADINEPVTINEAFQENILLIGEKQRSQSTILL